MGQIIDLTAKDGFTFPAYVAEPAGKPKGAVVVVQEIFGVNSHIRSVADGYAAEGYLAVAPATFQRVKQGVELGYTDDDMKAGFALKTAVEALPAPGVLQDLQAAVDHAARAGKVGIVGYCWGGLLTWRAAAEVSVLVHFGNNDHWIPLDTVDDFKKAHPEVEVHVYECGHGFNCDQRGSYDATAAKLARERTLAFFGKHVG